jgi:heterodisulfide reductase subunit B
VKADPDSLEVLNNFMDREEIEYEGDVQVFHLLEFLKSEITFESLAEKVVKPLKKLKIASYYGCLLVRPKEIGFDDMENPTILEDLMTVLGADSVDFPFKTECCGAYQTVDRPDIVAERTLQILSSAQNQGAEVVVVSCPLCAFNLDQRQKKAAELFPEFKNIPVLYFTQPLAIALGCPEKTLRFDLNFIDPRPLLRKKGFI